MKILEGKEKYSFHRSRVNVRSVIAAEEIKHVAVVVATAEECEICVGDRWPYIIIAAIISNNYVGEAGVGTLRRIQGGGIGFVFASSL